jgi:hypothetical protein
MTRLGRRLTLGLLGFAVLIGVQSPASAQSLVSRSFAADFGGAARAPGPTASWLGHPATFLASPVATARLDQSATAPQAAPAPGPPFEYSDGYKTRLKIHKIASFATIPLFVTQLFLGQSLYEDATADKKTAHIVVGSSIGVLFGVNSVTGVWNLIEARKDPNGRGLRVAHGLLMLSADAGFVTTGLLAPDGEGGGNRTAHRAMAITSIAVATTGYLLMLFGNR